MSSLGSYYLDALVDRAYDKGLDAWTTLTRTLRSALLSAAYTKVREEIEDAQTERQMAGLMSELGRVEAAKQVAARVKANPPVGSTRAAKRREARRVSR